MDTLAIWMAIKLLRLYREPDPLQKRGRKWAKERGEWAVVGMDTHEKVPVVVQQA